MKAQVLNDKLVPAYAGTLTRSQSSSGFCFNLGASWCPCVGMSIGDIKRDENIGILGANAGSERHRR
jgi:hypothetical protein